jgi:septal ring factor EnvC (AmiA/AmiB activator)
MKRSSVVIKRLRKFFLLFSGIVLFSGFLLSVSAKPQQSSQQKELEDKKKLLQQEIEYKKKLLEEIKSGKYRSMLQVALLNSKIKDHEAMINMLGGEINELNSRISETSTSIRTKEDQLKKLKEDYSRMVIAAYKNRSSYDRLMFIFCAADFNQAYQRMKYYQVYTSLRKKQADEIEHKKKELTASLQGLEQKKNEQNRLLSDKEIEKNNLSHEKEDKTHVLSDLRKQEGDVKKEIQKKKLQADKIKKLIDKIVADEIKKQQELLAKKNKDSKKDPNDNKKDPKKKNDELKIELTPEELIVSKSFEGNEGKLPWPMEKGVITERFGQHEHPDMPGIIVNNTGVEITSNRGAIARSIFNGEVVAVSEIDGVEGKVVIIRHGEYLSVYYALENVYVQKGDKVTTKQEIGKVVTDEDGKTELHLEIYKGKKLLDPENWIVIKG